MGAFDGTFERKKRFKMIPITAAACDKDHELLVIGVWKWISPNSLIL